MWTVNQGRWTTLPTDIKSPLGPGLAGILFFGGVGLIRLAPPFSCPVNCFPYHPDQHLPTTLWKLPLPRDMIIPCEEVNRETLFLLPCPNSTIPYKKGCIHES